MVSHGKSYLTDATVHDDILLCGSHSTQLTGALPRRVTPRSRCKMMNRSPDFPRRLFRALIDSIHDLGSSQSFSSPSPRACPCPTLLHYILHRRLIGASPSEFSFASFS